MTDWTLELVLESFGRFVGGFDSASYGYADVLRSMIAYLSSFIVEILLRGYSGRVGGTIFKDSAKALKLGASMIFLILSSI
jgi:hypothetical protein